MTVVVVYESMYGNTHRIAEAIGQGLIESSSHAEVVSVEAARERRPGQGDVVVVGAPTHVHGLSRASTREAAVHDAPGRALQIDPSVQGAGVREWLETLDIAGCPAAAFDTRAKGPAVLTGRASQKIAKNLQEPGCDLVVEPERLLVSSTNQMLPEEDARARQWEVELAVRIRPTQS